MKSYRILSPDILKDRKNKLVPFKHKHNPNTNITELPGWRMNQSKTPDSIKVEPSKLFKIKSKEEYFLPQITAMEKYNHIVLESKKTKAVKKLQKSKKTVTKNEERPRNEIPKIKKIPSASQKLKQNQIVNKDTKGFNKIYELDSIKDTKLETIMSLKIVKKLTGDSNLNTFYDSPLGTKSEQSTLTGRFNSTDKFNRGVITPTLQNKDFSASKEKIFDRRKSENLVIPQNKPMLSMPQRKTMNVFDELRNLKNTETDLIDSPSESVSDDDDEENPNEENPIEEINLLRDKLDVKLKTNQRRPSGRLLFVDMDSCDRSSSDKRGSLSISSVSFNDSKFSDSNKYESDKKHLQTVPRKSVTKQFSKKNFLTQPENVKRSSTTTVNQIITLTSEDSKISQLFGNGTPIELKSALKHSLTPSPQTLNKELGLLTPKNSILTRPSHSLTSSSNKSKPKAESKPIPQTQGKVLDTFSLEKRLSYQPQSKLPEKTLSSQKSLKLPPKKTQTFNFNVQEKPPARSQNKQLTEKSSENFERLTNKKKKRPEQDHSKDPDMKVLIKITEAPDSTQQSFYKESNFLVSVPHNEEKLPEHPENSLLSLPNHHLLAKPKGQYSDLPSRSRANSHEWLKPESNNAELARKRMSSKKNSKNLMVPLQDYRKKSLSSSKNKNSSEMESEDFYSEHSYESNFSNYSKISISKKVSLDRKFLKKTSVSSRSNSIRNPNSLKYLKNFISTEVNKKLGHLDPVTNFLYNFSFSILKCMSSLIKINSFRRGSKQLNKQRSKKFLASELFEKDNLASGKLKINKNKRESNIFNQITLQVPVRKMKTHKKTNSPQAYYPREITLKAMHSRKISKDKAQQAKNPQQTLQVTNESPEESSSQSSDSDSSSIEEVVQKNYSKKTLLYELAHQDLTLNIAKQILEANVDDNESKFDNSEICDDEVSDSDDSQCLQDEINEFRTKFCYFNGKYAFGHEVDIKALQRQQMVYSFKEIEDGLFEVDMDNLKRESNKKLFFEKNILENENRNLNSKGKELILLPDWNMTEEQMYRARIQKVRLSRKKLALRIERTKAEKEKQDVFDTASDVIKLKIKPEAPSFGDTFEERVYFRLKGSASPIFLKKSK